MLRHVIAGLAVSLASMVAANLLTLFAHPGPLGYPRALALGVAVAAIPVGVLAGLMAGRTAKSGAVAATSAAVTLLGWGIFSLAIWRGSWDLPLIVTVAVVVQTAALLVSAAVAARLIRRRA